MYRVRFTQSYFSPITCSPDHQHPARLNSPDAPTAPCFGLLLINNVAKETDACLTPDQHPSKPQTRAHVLRADKSRGHSVVSRLVYQVRSPYRHVGWNIKICTVGGTGGWILHIAVSETILCLSSVNEARRGEPLGWHLFHGTRLTSVANTCPKYCTTAATTLGDF